MEEGSTLASCTGSIHFFFSPSLYFFFIIRKTLQGSWVAEVSSLKSCRSIMKTSPQNHIQPVGM